MELTKHPGKASGTPTGWEVELFLMLPLSLTFHRVASSDQLWMCCGLGAQITGWVRVDGLGEFSKVSGTEKSAKAIFLLSIAVDGASNLI